MNNIIAIYRKARNNQVSTKIHLLNLLDIVNQRNSYNPHKNEANVLLYYSDKNKSIMMPEFHRNGNNKAGVQFIKQIEVNRDISARADYKAYKEQQKKANPEKKVRTVLQTKNLTKEFIIAFGSTDTKHGKKLTRADLSFTQNKAEFATTIHKGINAIFEKQGLTIDKNLIAATIHYDERGLPHCHVQYNDYSFIHHTTGSELNRCRDKTLNKKQQYLKQIDQFAEFQDILAESMKLRRGEHGGKRKNLSVNEYRKQEQQKEITRNQQQLIIVKDQISQEQQEQVYLNENKKARVELTASQVLGGIQQIAKDTSKPVETIQQSFETGAKLQQGFFE